MHNTRIEIYGIAAFLSILFFGIEGGAGITFLAGALWAVFFLCIMLERMADKTTRYNGQ